VQLVILGEEPLFFAARDDPWLPTLRLLHKYPLMMNRLRVDTGAIKFVLSGANIMSPGLTSSRRNDSYRGATYERVIVQARC